MLKIIRRIVPFVLALAAVWVVPRLWCGRDAGDWFDGDPDLQRALAEELVAFQAADDADREKPTPVNRFAGEWALVTHQMTALGLASKNQL